MLESRAKLFVVWMKEEVALGGSASKDPITVRALPACQGDVVGASNEAFPTFYVRACLDLRKRPMRSKFVSLEDRTFQ